MLRKNPETRPSISEVLQSRALGSYIVGLELPKVRPKSEETPKQRMLRHKQEKAQSEAELHTRAARESVELRQLSRLRQQELIYGASVEYPLLKTSALQTTSLLCSDFRMEPSSNLSPTYYPKLSDSLEYSTSLSSQDLSSAQQDRPIRAKGYYDIDSNLKKADDSDSEDEPFEDLQSQTTSHHFTKHMHPKYSADFTSYESKLAALRTQCLSNLGEDLFTRIYEFMRDMRARETSEDQVTSRQIKCEAQNRFGEKGHSLCCYVDRLVFLEDHGWGEALLARYNKPSALTGSLTQVEQGHGFV
jgi:hypothetical protein